MFKKPVIASILTLIPLLSAISSVKAMSPEILKVFGNYKLKHSLTNTDSVNQVPSPSVINSEITREEQNPLETITPSPAETTTPALSPPPSVTPSPSPAPTEPPQAEVFTVIERNTPYVLSADTDDSIKNFIMEEINRYRSSLGLYEVKTDSYTCEFAEIRAKEISENFNHKGFQDRVDSGSLPYPSYSKVTENLAMVANYTKVVSNWKKSDGHAANMRADTPNVCVEKYGNYYAYEGLRP